VAEEQKEQPTWEDVAKIEKFREMLRVKFGVA
jgi:hypothetical protein